MQRLSQLSGHTHVQWNLTPYQVLCAVNQTKYQHLSVTWNRAMMSIQTLHTSYIHKVILKKGGRTISNPGLFSILFMFTWKMHNTFCQKFMARMMLLIICVCRPHKLN